MANIPQRMLDAIRNKKMGKTKKDQHYYEVYDQYFGPFIGKEPTILEIGVQNGGSLYVWKEYFQNAKVFGIDIDPSCRQFDSDGVKVFIGHQADKIFLGQVIEAIGPIDIVIDDGGHISREMTVSFRTLWPALKDGGLYIVEDLSCSYLPQWGGGLHRPGTFIEFIKFLIDDFYRSCLKLERQFPDVGSICIWNLLCIITKNGLGSQWSGWIDE